VGNGIDCIGRFHSPLLNRVGQTCRPVPDVSYRHFFTVVERSRLACPSRHGVRPPMSSRS